MAFSFVDLIRTVKLLLTKKFFIHYLIFVTLAINFMFLYTCSYKLVRNLKSKENNTDKTDNTAIKRQFSPDQNDWISFNAIRHSIHSILFVSARQNDFNLAKFYLDLSLNFIKGQFVTIKQTVGELDTTELDRKLSKKFEKLGKLTRGRENWEKLSQISPVITDLGEWYVKLKQRFLKHTKTDRLKCDQVMGELEHRIVEQIIDVQNGDTCRKSKEVLHFTDFKFWKLGMGSCAHRITWCISVAMATNIPCYVNDTNFSYDPGNLKKYFNNTSLCEKSKSVNWIPFVSTRQPERFKGYLGHPYVPKEVKESIEFCHEDVSAWYAGVILKHMFNKSSFLYSRIVFTFTVIFVRINVFSTKNLIQN